MGIDKFVSEARALTNFTGNAVATLLTGTWTREIDMEQARAVPAGERPFDEHTLTVNRHWPTSGSDRRLATAHAATGFTMPGTVAVRLKLDVGAGIDPGFQTLDFRLKVKARRVRAKVSGARRCNRYP